MASVTQRIAEIKQPRGGYLKPSEFEKIIINDGLQLGPENISPSTVGLAVDYLSRFMMEREKNPKLPIRFAANKAFEISIIGYTVRQALVSSQEIKSDKKKGIEISQLLDNITGLDEKSIIAACKAAGYDVWYRNLKEAFIFNGPEFTNPDKTTIENIRIMVERSLAFFREYGPVTVDGFAFEKDGYTKTVDAGDGDFLTIDTLWDFKVSKGDISSKYTLQLLMYWIMGQHSKKDIFKKITRIGIYNPRLNTVYLFDISKCPKNLINDIEKTVICY